MNILGPGKQYIYDLAKKKMGKDVDMWLVTPHPDFKGIHDGTPYSLLESKCPSCLNDVLAMVEGMPDV